METLGEILSRSESEQHEKEPANAATLIEYLREADTQEQQLERTQEVRETIYDMLTYGHQRSAYGRY